MRGALAWTASLSPSLNPCLRAVEASIVASSAVRGWRPSLGLEASKRGLTATELMKFGAPPAPTRLPFLPSTVPASKTSPSATSTCGLALTVASTDAGTVCGVPPWSAVLISWCGVIAASVPLLVSVKILSKLPLIVSVKM